MSTIESPTRSSAQDAHSRGRVLPSLLRPRVVAAIFKRDIARYFSNPAGYLFITLFVFAGSWAAFCQQAFFNRNLANLDSLNLWFPVLLIIFIPAVTMTTWADERRQGTDELLLTLPARDMEVVLGKYFATLGIYTVSLAFTLSHVIILYLLGSPDLGVLFANYVGYWLMGAMLIALAMIASLLTSSVTLAFILGALFCAIPVLFNLVGSFAGSRTGRLLDDLSVYSQFRDFGTGVIPIAGVFYFVSLAAAGLYVNMILLGRRHWAGGPDGEKLVLHSTIRVVALAFSLASLSVLASGFGGRIDSTSEGLHTLLPETKNVINKIPSDHPVFIQAYYSPEVPRDYVAVKDDLINTLKQAAAMSKGKIRLNLVESELFSNEARNAQKQFGIEPRQVMVVGEAKQSAEEIILGVAFTSGAQEVVIPFFDRGLPVEYEVTRSIRVVSRELRRKVGVLETDAKLLGGFDFARMSQSREWGFVTELKKQYDVAPVSPDAATYPSDLDVLLVAQPSSLNQKQIDMLATYVKNGHPTLLLLDPLPMSNPDISPDLPKKPPGGMFGGGPPPEPKGSLRPLMDALALDWPQSQIVWNPYNPHPMLQLPRELVFIGPGSGADEPFNPKQSATSGLQEVLMFYGGYLRSKGGDGPDFIPLLQTNDRGGALAFTDIIQQNMFGQPTENRMREYFPTGKSYTVAARIAGQAPPDEIALEAAKKDPKIKQPPRAEIRAIAIADLDLVSDMMTELRASGNENFVFDNVTFTLNCVDVLAGDESMISLRKHRAKHRTLSRVEAITQKYIDNAQDQEKKAEQEAKDELAAAQKRLDAKVDEIRNQKDVDTRTKQINLMEVQQNENRKFEVAKAEVEDKKRRLLLESKADMEQAIRSVQNNIRYMAIAIPPLPALILGLVVFGFRLKREYQGVSPARLA